MTSISLPDGYIVACIDRRWYPIKVERLHTIDNPDGFLTLSPLFTFDGGDTTFADCAEAVQECWTQVHAQEAYEQEQWECLAAKSNVYPDRCTHYRDIIEEYTRHRPKIIRGWSSATVIMHSYQCLRCDVWHDQDIIEALTIEDALAQAAEACYTRYLECMQQDPVHHEQHAWQTVEVSV